jgi:hypothetical protein
MSDRVQRCRDEGIVLFDEVLRDATESLDAATPDGLLAIVGTSRHVYESIVGPLAHRSVEALDDEDLVVVLWQNRRLFNGEAVNGERWRASRAPRTRHGQLPPTLLSDFVRATLERALRDALYAHILERVRQFTAESEAA